MIKTPLVLIARVIGYRRITQRIEDIALAYPFDKCRYVGILTNGLYGPGERCLRKDYLVSRRVTFRGREFPAPGCIEEYLSGIYGNYKDLPPESERVDHGLRAWRIE